MPSIESKRISGCAILRGYVLQVGCNVTHADAKIELDLPGKILSRSWENCAMVTSHREMI